MLRGHFHLVTTLKRGEGIEMSKLHTENSLVKPNGSFSECVSTTFVRDCLNYVLHSVKLSQYHCLASYKSCRTPVECNYYVTYIISRNGFLGAIDAEWQKYVLLFT